MLLPPITFAAVDGLALYPAQPSLQDKTDGRTDALTATRTDSATYMLQRPGDYALPAIDVRWWNAGEGRGRDRASRCGDRCRWRSIPRPKRRQPRLARGRDWTGGRRSRRSITGGPSLLAGRCCVAGLAWIVPRAAAADCRLSSPAAAGLSAIRGLCVQPDSARGPSPAMQGRPISRCSTGCRISAQRPPDQRSKPSRRLHGDPVLDREIDAIEAELFARSARRRPLVAASIAAPRERCAAKIATARGGRGAEHAALPQQLNPVGASSASAYVAQKAGPMKGASEDRSSTARNSN